MLRFHLLGPLEVTRNGTMLDLGPPKQRAALAALLLAGGRVVSTDRLVQAVWGDDPPARALANLQVYVSRLRSLLHANDAPALVRRTPGYALSAGWVDMTEFRRLTVQATDHVRAYEWSEAADAASTAIGLWRGPFLDDVGDEPWVTAEAVQLDEQYAQCMECWVTGLLGMDNVSEAITRSQTVIEANPLREHGWWLRMMTLHRAGRQPEALEAFQRFAGELDEQLGLEPGPPLRELQTAILRHDRMIASWPNQHDSPRPTLPLSAPGPRSAPAQDGSIGVTVPAAIRPASSPVPDTIVGREPELATLDRVLDDVMAGGCRWVLLTGRAGIGKTRLANEASSRARDRGAVTTWTSCPDDLGIPAWWPLRALVSDLGSEPDEVFLPPTSADADTVRFVVYERFSNLLQAASARAPVLVVIDDAQWLDAASIRGLVYLAHTQRVRHLGVILTVRDREHRVEFDEALATISREEFAVHVPIGPLNASNASALLRQVAGDTITAADAFALMQRIGGNPLLLTEYARLPAQDRHSSEIPLAARGLLVRRLHRLPDGVLPVLGAAGVIGETFELDLLAAVTGLDILELADRLDAAVAESVIRPAAAGAGYQFSHGLIRDAVMAELTVLRRQTLHARVAQALTDRAQDPRTLIRRATHLSAALPIVGPAAVIEASSTAARAAENSWDWDNAAEQWESARNALGAMPDADPRLADDLMMARLDALSRTGRAQQVWDVAAAALDDAIATGRNATIGRLAPALVRSGGYWPFVAFGADPGPVVRRIAAAVPVVRGDQAAHARVLTAVAVGNSYGHDQNTFNETSQHAVQLAEELHDNDVLADTLVGRLAFLAATRADLAEYAETLDRLHGLSHADAAIDAVLEQCHRLRLSTFRGDLEDVENRLRQGVAGADRLRLAGLRVHFRWVEAMTAQWRGDLGRAAGLAETAYEAHRQFEAGSADVSYLASRLLIWWDRGALSDHPAEIAGSPDPHLWSALAAVEAGDLAAGRELLATRLGPTGPEYWYTLPTDALLAHAVADLGMADAAADLLDRLEPRADLFAALGPFAVVGPIRLSMGRLWALLGEEQRARSDLASAERMSRDAGHRTGLIRAQLAQLALDPPGEARSMAYRQLAAAATDVGMVWAAKQAAPAR